MRKFLRNLYLIPVYFYRAILSGFTHGCCRYQPTCSGYFVQAVKKHGIFKGTIMGGARLLRCTKHYLGGYDPVPEQWSMKAIKDAFIIYRKHD
jgi:conserved hypothetical protein YidD